MLFKPLMKPFIFMDWLQNKQLNKRTSSDLEVLCKLLSINYNDKVGFTMEIKQLLRKYIIMGSQNCIERTPEVILKEAIEGGITLFQFREKGKNSLVGEHKLALGNRLRQICKQNNIPYIVNDDNELVEQVKADGIHDGQEDLPV